jgi:hypothetical protein
MDQSRAIALLQQQRDKAVTVRTEPRLGAAWEKWHRDTEIVIVNIFGSESRHLGDFNGIDFTKGWVGARETHELDAKAYEGGFADADAILSSMQDEVTEFGIGASGPQLHPGALQQVEQIFARFHRVARQLRQRHGNRATLDVQDEYDVQDLLHALLIEAFDDVRPEESTPSYAGGSARADFLLPEHHLVIETKMPRRGLGARQLGDELLQDIPRYREHPKCHRLVCFVYDPAGLLANPKGIERDLTRTEGGFSVSVFIHPQ